MKGKNSKYSASNITSPFQHKTISNTTNDYPKSDKPSKKFKKQISDKMPLDIYRIKYFSRKKNIEDESDLRQQTLKTSSTNLRNIVINLNYHTTTLSNIKKKFNKVSAGLPKSISRIKRQMSASSLTSAVKNNQNYVSESSNKTISSIKIKQITEFPPSKQNLPLKRLKITKVDNFLIFNTIKITSNVESEQQFKLNETDKTILLSPNKVDDDSFSIPSIDEESIGQLMPRKGSAPNHLSALTVDFRLLFDRDRSNYSFIHCMNKVPGVENNVLRFLNLKDVVALAMTSKVFWQKFKHPIREILISSILSQNDSFLRLRIWSVISTNSKMTQTSAKFAFMSARIKSCTFDNQIKKDLCRTRPSDVTFKDDAVNHKRLFDVLHCFAVYNNDIGYAQGLNFIAAQAILVIPEDYHVFRFLCGFMETFLFDEIIGEKTNNLVDIQKELNSALAKHCFKFGVVLNRNKLTFDCFFTPWLITVFSCSCQAAITNKIWDLFFIYKWRFLYRFIIEIFIFYEDNMINENVYKLSKFIKDLLQSEDFSSDFNILVTRVINFLT